MREKENLEETRELSALLLPLTPDGCEKELFSVKETVFCVGTSVFSVSDLDRNLLKSVCHRDIALNTRFFSVVGGALRYFIDFISI